MRFPRRERLPLFLWTPDYPAAADDTELERVIKELDARGISLLARWKFGELEKSAALALRIGKIQKKLGLKVCVEGTGDVVHGLYDGKPDVAHQGADGKPFFDDSFFWKAGCPFTMKLRYEKMKSRLEPFLKKYAEAGVELDFWTADYEFDGPSEWNAGWAAAKKCTVCREHIKDIDSNFTSFQNAVRAARSDFQNEVFCKTIRSHFPKALIGVYGMNPHKGTRYWWDFFEKPEPIEGISYTKENGGLHRPWVHEFEPAGYNVAMPVIYSLYNAYNFENKEFGWFYNMLLEASAVGEATPVNIPLIPFVHWSITAPKGKTPLSEQKYEEVLWHLLLRGHDTFCMWSPAEQTAQAVKPVHRVYAAALEFSEFLNKGTPVTFAVPSENAPVLSALRLGNRLLVRRTDFGSGNAPAILQLDGRDVSVPRADGKCQIITLP
ncbi:MAG TPA: hypothetical protein VEK08_08055 [Planctomycetota bacterium]|nr:hypothetical protein [Planctomycetota bacterium]